MNFLEKLQKSFDFWFVLGCSFVFFLLRLPSFFEPYWYGDEGVYEVLGYGMRHGRLLYQGIWDNKPPLLYLIYAAFDGYQPAVKLLSCLVGIAALIVFYFLAKLLFEKKKSIYLTTAIFTILFGLPLLEGNIANAENFMILPAIASMYLLIWMGKEKKFPILSFFLTGLLLGVSFLIKVVAVFDFATILFVMLCILFAFTQKKIMGLAEKYIVVSFGFVIPFILTLGFFASQGILKTFIQSAFLSNVGYVGYGNKFVLPFTHIVISQGFLLVKLLILGVILLGIFVKRKSLSLTQIFLYEWLAFSLFNAFFSQRPYTHYLLVLLPSIVLFTGIVIEKKWKVLHTLLLVGIVLLLIRNFWFYIKVPQYYENFFAFVTNQKTMTQYQSFFDVSVPRIYAVADFLKANISPTQKVFVWTNSPQLYYLIGQLPLGRYTVAYHILANSQTLTETAIALKIVYPRFIVLMPDAPSFPVSVSGYAFKLSLDGGLIYERIF